MLPEEEVDGPGDRILVATARLPDATLLTRDARILSYGKGRYVSVKAV